jgi:hypothetical protein
MLEVMSAAWLYELATSMAGVQLGYFRLVSGETPPKLEIRVDGDTVRVCMPGAYLTTGDLKYDFDSLILRPGGGVSVRYYKDGVLETTVIR